MSTKQRGRVHAQVTDSPRWSICRRYRPALRGSVSDRPTPAVRHRLAERLRDGVGNLARQRAELFSADLDLLCLVGQFGTRGHRREAVDRTAGQPRRGRVGRQSPGLARTAVERLPWETTHLSAFALLGVEPWQLIGLTIANGLIVFYILVAACTGGRRSVHDFVAATEVCPVRSESES